MTKGIKPAAPAESFAQKKFGRRIRCRLKSSKVSPQDSENRRTTRDFTRRARPPAGERRCAGERMARSASRQDLLLCGEGPASRLRAGFVHRKNQSLNNALRTPGGYRRRPPAPSAPADHLCCVSLPRHSFPRTGMPETPRRPMVFIATPCFGGLVSQHYMQSVIHQPHPIRVQSEFRCRARFARA